MNDLVASIAIWLIRLLRRLPLTACFGIGRCVGALLWLVLPGYRKLAAANMQRALNLSPVAARRLVWDHFLALGANALSALKIPTLTFEEVEKVIEVEGIDEMRRAIAGGRGVLAAINHMGNWELYAHLAGLVPGARLGTVFQALRNKRLNDFINGIRSSQGTLTFDRRRGFNGALALLREPGILGVLIDQNAGDGGIWMPFFNRLSSTSPLAASLAQRAGAALVPASIQTIGFARWRVAIRPEVPSAGRSIEEVTLAVNQVLESQIRESPKDWFWVHNRWKVPHPNFLITQHKRGVHVPEECADELAPFRIIIRSPNWLGDAVMSIPAVRSFIRGRPDARVSILCLSKLAPLWRTVSDVAEVIEMDKRESVWSVARKLRGKFDVGVLFPNSLRSAIEMWLAGVPRRAGFPGHGRRFFLNQKMVRKKKGKVPHPWHHADRYLFLAKKCGGEGEMHGDPQWCPPSEVTIGVCPGAEFGPAKQWPADRFREVMRIISAEINPLWKLFGTAGDANTAEMILAGFRGRYDNRVGKTSLDQLIDELRSVTVLVTNDTGTMHLADYLGVPLIAIFGSTEPVLTGPRGALSKVLRDHVPCSPCFLRECPIDFRCMKGIAPEKVADELLGLIDRAVPETVPVRP